MILKNLLNFCLRSLHKFDRFISYLLIWFISTARPLLGTENICPFTIGCTNFAIFNLENQSVPLALWYIFKRILICNPINFIFRNLFLKNN